MEQVPLVHARMTCSGFLVCTFFLAAAAVSTLALLAWLGIPHPADPRLLVRGAPWGVIGFDLAWLAAALAAIVLRLRDTGASGWWAALLPLAAAGAAPPGAAGTMLGLGAAALAAIAWILLIGWPGTIGPNRNGADPRGWESREHYDAEQAANAEAMRIAAQGARRPH
ncbi:DUF805 domain-containing protein [Sphingomonas canadensis]|uniref:DUF805 domain-containing protein n=1 Tax=Sphingomonas canadensis TaxID=1219257 RepID=A0ABW3HBJ8_9SPHN|nr:DUF805 domain-containing protein [Sphingomonas canadensis]MCW3837209.1 DUF805 domain-containing protein [Sphingomonas canadensis]